MASSPAAVPFITTLAGGSQIAHYRWQERGIAPRGYIKGMAVMFGRAYCKLKAGDVAARDMAKPLTGDAHRDALTYYNPEFLHHGWHNRQAGPDALRHLFVLMVGLGMRESGGHYDEGRDMSAVNTSASTAEAGLFQVSWNSHGACPYLLMRLMDQYAGEQGFLDIFREGTRARPASLANWGKGSGADFQRLSKACPAFAVEYVAVALRHVRTHWGPINRKHAELRKECDTLFL